MIIFKERTITLKDGWKQKQLDALVREFGDIDDLEYYRANKGAENFRYYIETTPSDGITTLVMGAEITQKTKRAIGEIGSASLTK